MKKLISRAVLALVAVTLITGCGSSGGGDGAPVAGSSADCSQYAGSWVGSFYGGDRGIWSATINANCSITEGSSYSYETNDTDEIAGEVNGTTITMINLGNGGTMTGSFSSTTAMAGSWQAGGVTGTWDGSLNAGGV